MPQLLPPSSVALNSIIAFQNLPAEVLDWLRQAGELRQYAPGETIVNAGDPAEVMLGVVAGGMELRAQRNGQFEPVFHVEAGRVSGVLPYSRLQVLRGQAVAEGETVLYVLPRSKFPALEQVSPELVQRLVAIMSDRARDEVRTQERDDKLRALGKLSAGLSHELNNPAAAISRASASLATALQAKPLLLKNLLSTCPPPAAVAALATLAGLPAAPGPTGHGPYPPQRAASRRPRRRAGRLARSPGLRRWLRPGRWLARCRPDAGRARAGGRAAAARYPPGCFRLAQRPSHGPAPGPRHSRSQPAHQYAGERRENVLAHGPRRRARKAGRHHRAR